MTLKIDKAAGTCTIEKNGQVFQSALTDARITTDPNARMSELHVGGASLHISETQAEELLVHGAQDDRTNLIVDD